MAIFDEMKNDVRATLGGSVAEPTLALGAIDDRIDIVLLAVSRYWEINTRRRVAVLLRVLLERVS